VQAKQESLEDKKADLGATIIKLGSNNYKLKIWNKGKAPARNVTVSFPEGNDLVGQSELTEKFPLEVLDTYQSVDLIAFVHLQTKPKHVVCLTWSDDSKNHNEKTVYPTL
jgi:hypothetical protein